MRVLACAAAAAMFLMSTQSKAVDGSSGCGPAWYVFKENSILSSFARALTNGTLSPVVTIGMTFGTSNCAKHNLVMQDQDSLLFASRSFDVLRQDIARGQGEYLDAYLASFDCQPLVRPGLSGSLQKAFQDGLDKSQDPGEFVSATRFLIDASAANMCS